MDQDLMDKLAAHNATVSSTVAEDSAKANPSNVPGRTSAERQRVPMSTPVQKLEVPPIPGFHLHWFRGWEAGRIQRALRAGYEFVQWDEVALNNLDLGGESAASGNTDLGSGVSAVAGEDVGPDGQPKRLVLMKIKTEWYEADQKVIAERNEKVAAAIRGGQVGATGAPGDVSNRYAKDISKNLFTPKHLRQPA